MAEDAAAANHYRALFALIDEGVCVIERLPLRADGRRDYRILDMNPAMRTMFDIADLRGKTLREQFPDGSEAWYDDYERVIETGVPLRFERRSVFRDMILDMTVSRIDDGATGQLLVVIRDVTARYRAEEAARASEERQAFLLGLSDALRSLADARSIEAEATRLVADRLEADRVFLTEVEADGVTLHVRHEYLRSGAFSVLGDYRFDQFGAFVGREMHLGHILPVEDVSARDDLSAIERANYARVGVAAYLLIPLIRNGRLAAYFTLTHRTPRTWSPADMAVARQVADRTWTAMERARAEVALRESEARLQVVVAELQHRVRNILAVVRSVHARTVDGAEDLEAAIDHFKGRLDALARTQVIVTQNLDVSADLENLVRDELLSVGVHDGPSVILAGPEVQLPAKVAEMLGLAIHELATNALKYGAIKVPGARLAIGWEINMDHNGGRTVDLCWREQGVPAIAAVPARRGFGRELIEEALPYRLRAETKLEFLGGGVRCTISIPLEGAKSAS